MVVVKSRGRSGLHCPLLSPDPRDWHHRFRSAFRQRAESGFSQQAPGPKPRLLSPASAAGLHNVGQAPDVLTSPTMEWSFHSRYHNSPRALLAMVAEMGNPGFTPRIRRPNPPSPSLLIRIETVSGVVHSSLWKLNE
jgi:hypothetical protein